MTDSPTWSSPDGRTALWLGDCLEVMAGMPANSVDAVVTDPPYGLSEHRERDVRDCLRAWLDDKPYAPKKRGFMGKSWDAWVPGPEAWSAALRVLKPGGHALVFAGTRSVDLMGIALRLAGFETRDTVLWLYGQGFPKSLDVSKAIDKAAGAKRTVIGRRTDRAATSVHDIRGGNLIGSKNRIDLSAITAPATPAARQWEGYGTGLKPAWEPIVLARKPLEGTVAANVLRWGTGALNIDGCRLERNQRCPGNIGPTTPGPIYAGGKGFGASPHTYHERVIEKGLGRWPANVCHDGSEDVVEGFPKAGGGFGTRGLEDNPTSINLGGKSRDSGSASRFFYCAKASKRDRDEGLEEFERVRCGGMSATEDGSMKTGSGNDRVTARANRHATVKPTALMRWLCRLVTPPDGLILDPFCGSGSTGKAAVLEGFRFAGIEQDEQWIPIARARIEAATRGDFSPDAIRAAGTGAVQETMF